jgi:hypothetical protein
MLAEQVAKRYPNATLFWGSFSKSPNSLEREIKFGLFPNSIYVGRVSSSTDECEAVRKAALAVGKQTGHIVVIADGAHSRRCKRVWEYLFPNSEICFRSVPAWLTADKENPMRLQRNWRVWLLANILADTLAYRWEPVLRFLIKENFSQPTN